MYVQKKRSSSLLGASEAGLDDASGCCTENLRGVAACSVARVVVVATDFDMTGVNQWSVGRITRRRKRDRSSSFKYEAGTWEYGRSRRVKFQGLPGERRVFGGSHPDVSEGAVIFFNSLVDRKRSLIKASDA